MIRITKNANKLLILIFLSLCNFNLLADNVSVTLIYVGDESSTAYLGAQQGLTEANLQGEFLGQSYTLKTLDSENIASQVDESVVAVLVASHLDDLKSISAQLPDTAILNIALDDDSLRFDCSTNQLHVIPSQKMKSDALAQWLQKEADSKAVAQAWHHDFKKFAARDLNKRFKKAHNVEMDDLAWAGWAAVKIVSDTVVRENLSESAAVLEYLKTELAFDGQKGLNMDFRSNGQLRQPILIVENDKILAEAPIRGIANPPTVESLGLTECH